MWADGISSLAIASEFETSIGTVCSMLSRYRDMFPARRKSIPRKPKTDLAPPAKQGPKDRVVRTTISGAKVTLARVPTIDGDSV